MSTKEGDPKNSREKRQISLSAYAAIELANDLTEYNTKQKAHASEIKKTMQTLTKTLNYVGAFSDIPESEKRYQRKLHGTVIIKILDYDEVKFENAKFYHDLWLDQNGKLLLYGIISPPNSHEESQETFIEASDSEYVMLYPWVLKGVGEKIAKGLPTNT